MTPEQMTKAIQIVRRLVKQDFGCNDHRGRKNDLLRMGGEIMDAFTAGDWDTFLARAKELNEIYKGLSIPAVEIGEDQEHWEIGGDK